MRLNNERIVCADGFSMSVQASESHYCAPRIDNAIAYTEVEVGYPSNYEALLVSWVDNPEDYVDAVYGFVPSQVIVDICAKHGGIVSGQLPPGVIYLEAPLESR